MFSTSLKCHKLTPRQYLGMISTFTDIKHRTNPMPQSELIENRQLNLGIKSQSKIEVDFVACCRVPLPACLEAFTCSRMLD